MLRVVTPALLVVALVATNLTAQEVKDDKKKTVDDQTLCPIMVKRKIENEGEDEVSIVEYTFKEGKNKGEVVKVALCCDVCVKKWKADPEAYLDVKFIPQLEGMDLPKRKIEQMYCPVYPDRKVSEKDTVVEYKGKKIYVFNKSAKRKFERRPEKYADPKILPQLRGPDWVDEDADKEEKKDKKEGDGKSDK